MPRSSISSTDVILIRNLLRCIARSMLLCLSRFSTVIPDTSTRVMLRMRGSWFENSEHPRDCPATSFKHVSPAGAAGRFRSPYAFQGVRGESDLSPLRWHASEHVMLIRCPRSVISAPCRQGRRVSCRFLKYEVMTVSSLPRTTRNRNLS